MQPKSSTQEGRRSGRRPALKFAVDERTKSHRRSLTWAMPSLNSAHQPRRVPRYACGGVAQLVRVPACHAGGRGFEPRRSRQFLPRLSAVSRTGLRPWRRDDMWRGPALRHFRRPLAHGALTADPTSLVGASEQSRDWWSSSGRDKAWWSGRRIDAAAWWEQHVTPALDVSASHQAIACVALPAGLQRSQVDWPPCSPWEGPRDRGARYLARYLSGCAATTNARRCRGFKGNPSRINHHVISASTRILRYSIPSCLHLSI